MSAKCSCTRVCLATCVIVGTKILNRTFLSLNIVSKTYTKEKLEMLGNQENQVHFCFLKVKGTCPAILRHRQARPTNVTFKGPVKAI